MYKQVATFCNTLKQRLLWWRSYSGAAQGWATSPPPRFLLVLMLAAQILFLALIRLGPAASFWTTSSAARPSSVTNLRLHVRGNAAQQLPTKITNSSSVEVEQINQSTVTPPLIDVKRADVQHSISSVKNTFQKPVTGKNSSRKRGKSRSKRKPKQSYRGSGAKQETDALISKQTATDFVISHDGLLPSVSKENLLVEPTIVRKDGELALQKAEMEKQTKDVLRDEEDAIAFKSSNNDANVLAEANTATEVHGVGKASTLQDKDRKKEDVETLEAFAASKPAVADVDKSEEANKDAYVGVTEQKASPSLQLEATEKQSTKVLEKQKTFPTLQEEHMEKASASVSEEDMQKQETSPSLHENYVEERSEIPDKENSFSISEEEDMEKPNVQNLLKQEASSNLEEEDTKSHSEFSAREDSSPSLQEEKMQELNTEFSAREDSSPSLLEEKMQEPNTEFSVREDSSPSLQEEKTQELNTEFLAREDSSPSLQEDKMHELNTEVLVAEEASPNTQNSQELNVEKQEAGSSILQEINVKNQNEEILEKPSVTLEEKGKEQTTEVLEALPTAKNSANPEKALDIALIDENQNSNSEEENGFSSSSCKYGYIYVYDLPSEFNREIVANCTALNPWYDMCIPLSNGGLGESLGEASPLGQVGSWFNSDQFMAEVVFHNRILQHPCLTDKPELASGFYVPYYAGLDLGRYLWTGTAERRDRVSRQLVTWLQEQQTWKQSKGLDHFMMGGRITWDFRRSKDEDWGSSFFYNPGVQGVISRLVIERNPWDDKEMGVPYLTNFHPQSDADLHAWQQHLRMLMTNRNTLFSFAGASRTRFPNDFRGILLTQCHNTGSSVCKSLDCSNRTCEGNQKTMELFMDSMFCLQPRGDSFTRRSTFDCLLSGSIPVFFWRRTAYLQYPWHLPADPSSYSVFISKEDMRNGTQILDQLRAISSDKVRAMQESVIQLIPRLVFAASGFSLKEENDAFDVAIDGMLKKFHDQAGLASSKR